MKEKETLYISRRQMRIFAKEIESGKFGVKYSYHGFHTKLVRKLLNLGLLEKGMVWSPERRTTIRIYQLKLQQVTERPPHSAFYRQAWQVAKGWNDLIQSDGSGSFTNQ